MLGGNKRENGETKFVTFPGPSPHQNMQYLKLEQLCVCVCQFSGLVY